MKTALILSSLYGATGVMLGALGAHALKDRLSGEGLELWETASTYQMYHALALLGVALLLERGFHLRAAMRFFAIGTPLFSGSIYLLALEAGPGGLLGPMTPIGGVCLILGWFCLLDQAIKYQKG